MTYILESLSQSHLSTEERDAMFMNVIAEIALVMKPLLGCFVVLLKHTSCEEDKVVGCGQTLETRNFSMSLTFGFAIVFRIFVYVSTKTVSN